MCVWQLLIGVDCLCVFFLVQSSDDGPEQKVCLDYCITTLENEILERLHYPFTVMTKISCLLFRLAIIVHSPQIIDCHCCILHHKS